MAAKPDRVMITVAIMDLSFIVIRFEYAANALFLQRYLLPLYIIASGSLRYKINGFLLRNPQ